ncbi:MAG: hypothetical protein GC151_10985 [Betaproteobacteria bacterium]|nr:hypothetical protein [Betaproteobacteria bacterium]
MARAEGRSPLSVGPCSIASFRVRVDGATLQTTLDRSLNAAHDGTSPLVVADASVWIHVATLAGAGGDDGAECHVVFLGIPVTGASSGAEPALYCPYVFVSESHELLTGLREDLGYPAWGARIDLRTRRDGMRELSVRTEVFTPGDPAPRPDTEVLFLAWRSSENRTGPPSIAGQRATSQLLQVRETTSPVLALLRDPVRLVWSGRVAGTPGREDATIAARAGYRNLDLVADLGLPAVDTTIAPEDCAFGLAEDLNCSLAPADAPPPRVLPAPTPFIEARIDPRAPPPYRFEDVSISGFVVGADRDRLQFLVDALLNTHAGLGEPRQYFRYVVATSQVIFELIDYGKLRSLAPATRWRSPDDFTSQHELAIRFLVGRTESDSDAATNPQVFCPFLFVDNWASMITGREILGLWKRLGSFAARPGNLRDADAIDTLSVRAGRHAVFACEHLRQPGDDRAVPLHALGGSKRRGLLPWQQHDFEAHEFRRDFAREWLAVSREQYRMIQRRFCPWPSTGPAIRQWVEMLYRIRRFDVALPRGAAKIRVGSFVDRAFADVLSRAADALGAREVPGLDTRTATIDIATLLGLEAGGEVTLPSAGWYLARGAFDLDVVDRFG